MKYLKTYKNYLESVQIDLEYDAIDLMESLNIWYDSLLNIIDAKEVDMEKEFDLSDSFHELDTDIDNLNIDVKFISSLTKKGLKKSKVENTDDYESFINKPFKFMMIYNINSNELENPEYMVMQIWNNSLKKWDKTKLFKINGDIKKFYDKLSSKTIEILDGDKNYIYTTSNANEWILQNVEDENDIYKKYFRKEEFEQLLNDRKIKLNII